MEASTGGLLVAITRLHSLPGAARGALHSCRVARRLHHLKGSAAQTDPTRLLGIRVSGHLAAHIRAVRSAGWLGQGTDS